MATDGNSRPDLVIFRNSFLFRFSGGAESVCEGAPFEASNSLKQTKSNISRVPGKLAKRSVSGQVQMLPRRTDWGRLTSRGCTNK